jgi:hypothetical protein
VKHTHAEAMQWLHDWPTRPEREHLTGVAVALDLEMRALVAERIAWRLVENTNGYRNRHFYVIDVRKPIDRAPLPFATQWRQKNASGVTFKRAAVAEASGLTPTLASHA